MFCFFKQRKENNIELILDNTNQADVPASSPPSSSPNNEINLIN